MMNAIRNDETPNFYFMQYDLAAWSVRNLLLVPPFAFPPSAIIKRKPLSITARRAGWIGCIFALNRIPVEARIDLVRTIASPSPPQRGGEGRGEVARIKSPLSVSLPAQSRGERVIIVPPEEVREKFKRVKPLSEISVKQRGWTLDVLNAIRRLGKTDLSRLGNGESNLAESKGPRGPSGRARASQFTTADAYAFTRELEKLHPDNRHVQDKIRQQLQVLRDTGLLLHPSRGEWKLP
jgi:type II restriction enzyme